MFVLTRRRHSFAVLGFAIIIATMSSLPSLYGADRTAVRSDRHDLDLRMFKSNVFVHDHDRSLRFYNMWINLDSM